MKKFYVVTRFFKNAAGQSFTTKVIVFTPKQVSALVESFYATAPAIIGHSLCVDTITTKKRFSHLFYVSPSGKRVSFPDYISAERVFKITDEFKFLVGYVKERNDETKRRLAA